MVLMSASVPGVDGYGVEGSGGVVDLGGGLHDLALFQAAVDKAAPGTAIMVKAGTYKENVQLTKDGTPSKPIWLTSADGIGKARAEKSPI